MDMTMKQIWLCFFGPRLHAVVNGDAATSRFYTPNGAERWGDGIVRSLSLVWKISVYTSPLIGLYSYKKDYFAVNSLPALFKFVSSVGLVAAASICLRGCGRLSNAQYREFVKTLTDPVKNRAALRYYDFDFEAWPVDFDVRNVKRTVEPTFLTPPKRTTRNLSDLALNIFGNIAVSTFGLALFYPGSTTLLNMFIGRTLLENRVKLIRENNGQRYKIKTVDGNSVDCMFFDRRLTQKGKTLFITAEGNAGFYEIGMVTTPIEAEYSALGWNHPGFGGSTGRPYPLQEQQAIDAVIQFAINELKFTPDKIILHGWSIGCYSVAWAATQYTNVKGVILDATFDDVSALACAKMPLALEPLVMEIVKNHVDLNVAGILKDYSGPLKLIRRTMDEIITVEEGDISTNRCNDLLIKILVQRYPDLMEEDQINAARHYLGLKMDPETITAVMDSFTGDVEKNKKVFSLIEKYLSNHQATHCTPLPVDYIEIP